MLRLRGADERPRHAVLDVWNRVWDYDRHFRDDEHIREVRHSYYATCPSLVHHVGRVIDALEVSGHRLTDEDHRSSINRPYVSDLVDSVLSALPDPVAMQGGSSCPQLSEHEPKEEVRCLKEQDEGF